MKKWGIFSVVVGHLLDLFTTALPGGEESNEWARTPSHHPLFGHLIVIKIAFLSAYFALGYMGYKSLQKLSQTLADFAVVGICIYMTYDLLDVVFGNALVYLNWYTP